jgi:predicted nuclease of predicted toxin-antitoxin system
MLLLANENVPRLTVEALRAAGHDTIWARVDMAGSSDEDVLSRAQTEGRVLLTHDKDFGDLAFHAGLPATCGIILIRLGKLALDAVVNRTVQAISSRSDWAGHLAIIDGRRIRMRPLPRPNSP